MKRILLFLLLTGIGAYAQPPSVTTNIVTALPAFRLVNGQLYNTDLSTNFATLEGQCLKVLSNGVIIQRMEMRQTYLEVPTNAVQVAAALAGAPVPLLSEEYVPGKKFFIRNYPDQPLAEIGSRIVARAMRDGVFNYESEIMELWDYGTPNKVAVVTINGAGTNALKRGVFKP